MPLASEQARVRVPATSANLGPGFDCLGLALELHLQVTCRLGGQRSSIAVRGSETGDISAGEDNRVLVAMRAVFAAAGEEMAGIELQIENAIPLSRGLGSSAAAVASGLMLANSLLGRPFERQELLSIGLPIEGHPDNLAPALFGGLTVSTIVQGRAMSLSVRLAKDPQVVLFVPDFAMSTKEARAVLPESVPRADAIFNTGRSSLLVAALAGGDFSVLRWAMEDRLHQPYRSRIFPALPDLVRAALDAGASGAALSGAGSTVIALCERRPEPIAQGLEAAARRLGLAGRCLFASIDHQGAVEC